MTFSLNYQQRLDLINSIEDKGEIPAEFLEAIAESIRTKQLTKKSWRKEDDKYYARMARLMMKYDKK